MKLSDLFVLPRRLAELEAEVDRLATVVMVDHALRLKKLEGSRPWPGPCGENHDEGERPEGVER